MPALPPQPSAVYAGVREIETTGTWSAEPAAARYRVTERYVTVSWERGIATVRATIAYAPLHPPARGIMLTTAALDQDERVSADGSVRLLRLNRVTHAADAVAGPTSGSAAYDRSVDLTFATEQLGIPASLKPHMEKLPLDTVSHVRTTDGGVFGSSSVSGSTAESDVRRTTLADGSFEDIGYTAMQPSVHRISQHADGSAHAYDAVPGFSMRDVTVATPAGSGPDAHVAVTVKTQGRTVGPTPVDTHEYVVPVWYAATWPAPLATATLTVEARRAADARCALGAAPVIPVVIRRRHVDVTDRIVEERDERDLDASRRVLCHITATMTRRFDVTAGYETGTLADTTVVHLIAQPRR